jgi:hypothetical protein
MMFLFALRLENTTISWWITYNGINMKLFYIAKTTFRREQCL